jgi:hypothetical protein
MILQRKENINQLDNASVSSDSGRKQKEREYILHILLLDSKKKNNASSEQSESINPVKHQ